MGMPLAIIAFIVIMLIPMQGLSYPGHAAIALLVFAVIMWATETVHLAVTSLIILFIQPIIGVESFDSAVIGFANPIIFLMIGGFIIDIQQNRLDASISGKLISLKKTL